MYSSGDAGCFGGRRAFVRLAGSEHGELGVFVLLECWRSWKRTDYKQSGFGKVTVTAAIRSVRRPFWQPLVRLGNKISKLRWPLIGEKLRGRQTLK